MFTLAVAEAELAVAEPEKSHVQVHRLKVRMVKV